MPYGFFIFVWALGCVKGYLSVNAFPITDEKAHPTFLIENGIDRYLETQPYPFNGHFLIGNGSGLRDAFTSYIAKPTIHSVFSLASIFTKEYFVLAYLFLLCCALFLHNFGATEECEDPCGGLLCGCCGDKVLANVWKGSANGVAFWDELFGEGD